MTRQRSSMAIDIAVVGSINEDLVTRVVTFPLPGETVISLGMRRGLGGKGANQAVAAAKVGAGVAILGRVGSDDVGRTLLDSLRSFGVITDFVGSSGISGCATIAVDGSGENCIIVTSGANADYVFDGSLAKSGLPNARLFLVQGELPGHVIAEVAQYATSVSARFVLNLAPYCPVLPESLAAADPLIVNESEAADLCADLGIPIDRPELSVSAALTIVELLAQRCSSVVITMGSQGAVASDGHSIWHEAAVVLGPLLETTGAGDVLCGVMAAHIASGRSLRDSLRMGVLAASIAVTRPGAIDSYPTVDELHGKAART